MKLPFRHAIQSIKLPLSAKKIQTKTKKRWKKLPLLVKAIIFLGVLGILGAVTAVALTIRDLPSPNKLQEGENYAVSSQIFDRKGTLLYEIFADKNRTPILLKDLPPYMGQATIAIEDKNFYHHFGFDVQGILRAFLNNAKGGSLQGGSTLTQQLVKTSLLSPDRTWKRKFKEAILTVSTEVIYSKDQILEMYLNYVPYGGTAYGVQAASETFFGKPAKDLNLAEAAYIAGLPQSPSRYSPFGNSPELGIQRQKDVLKAMVDAGFITKAQQDEAAGQDLVFAKPKSTIKAPHFVFYIRDQLVDQYGEQAVERGGLRVTTTLDYDLQNVVQASLSAEINKLSRLKVSNGAAVVTKPDTGEILAMVGSRDYFNATAGGQINMTNRDRQPGSSIKPLDLATALELRKLTLGSMLLDIPSCFDISGQAPYCPQNYDSKFHGPVLMRTALANSFNIPAVKVMATNSVENFVATASAMGLTTIKNPRDYGISLGLGAGEIKMVDMATAYGVLANQGVKVPLVGVQKVEDYTGKVLYQSDTGARHDTRDKVLFLNTANSADKKPIPDLHSSDDPEDIYRVFNPETTWLVNSILRDNNARAIEFGTNSSLYVKGEDVAAKTGTTNDLRDNWTIGFTPDYLTAVWVGNNDNSAMSGLASGITGAAPIWNDIMSYLLKKYPDRVKNDWPKQPDDIVQVPVCSQWGGLVGQTNPDDPTTSCTPFNEYFWKGTEPQAPTSVRNNTWIVSQTGLPAREGDPVDQLKLENHILLTDPFTRDYCLDCVRQTVNTTDPQGNPVTQPVPESYVVPAERIFEASQGFGWPSDNPDANNGQGGENPPVPAGASPPTP